MNLIAVTHLVSSRSHVCFLRLFAFFSFPIADIKLLLGRLLIDHVFVCSVECTCDASRTNLCVFMDLERWKETDIFLEIVVDVFCGRSALFFVKKRPRKKIYAIASRAISGFALSGLTQAKAKQLPRGFTEVA